MRPWQSRKQARTRLPERDRPPTAFPGMCLTHTPLLLARQRIPPRLILPKSTARATSCSSRSPPLAFFRNGRLTVLLSRASLIPAANSSSLPKKGATSSETTRPYNTSCACLTPACTSNMDEKSVASISPCGNASEKISCLRQVRSKPSHANPLLGHRQQTSRGS